MLKLFKNIELPWRKAARVVLKDRKQKISLTVIS